MAEEMERIADLNPVRQFQDGNTDTVEAMGHFTDAFIRHGCLL
jgi:hypothetical protein